MNLLDWDDNQDNHQVATTEPETVTLTIILPKGKTTADNSSLNRWSGLDGFSIRNDEKNFIRGFIAGLQLTHAQKQALLQQYVIVWNKAYQQEGKPRLLRG